MKEIVEVNTGEVKVEKGEIILRSIVMGTCVVLSVYDFTKHVGGMAHIRLPGSCPKKAHDKMRYAANAITELISKMKLKGTKKTNIEACLVGGGETGHEEDGSVHNENIESTIELLKKKKIPIRATVVGGSKIKGVFLDIENGNVSYTEGKEERKSLPESNDE